MGKLSQSEWVAVGCGLVVIVLAFVFGGTSLLQPGPETRSDAIPLELTDTTMATSSTQSEEPKSDRVAQSGDTVSVNYVGKLENGTVFDNSYDRGEPIEFKLGSHMVIEGWEKGILGMKIGEKKHLVIPPELGYGPEDYGPIPGNSTLIFDVELVGIK